MELWDVRGGQWTLKARILRLEGEVLRALCPRQGCGGTVTLPFLALQPPPEPPPRRRRLAVRARKADG